MQPKRIVVKVGSSSLTDAKGHLAKPCLGALAEQISELRRSLGIQVILVSSGAVAAGVGHLGWQRGAITLREKQAAAAVGQGLLIDAYREFFASDGIEVAQILLTRSDLDDRHRYVHIRNTLETLLRHGVLPIVNENDTVAVDEIRVGDNDTLAGLVALAADADLLLLLTDTDGFYDRDPRHDPEAQRIPDVLEIDGPLMEKAGRPGTGMGTGGMRTKLLAARIAMDAGIDALVAPASDPDVLRRAVEGPPIGTRFHARPERQPRKKLWMVHSSRPNGRLTIDDGAAAAVLSRSASLLLPGIRMVEGDFRSGDVVELVTLEGRVIGRGIVTTPSWELRHRLSFPHDRGRAAMLRVVHHREMAVLKGEGLKPC